MTIKSIVKITSDFSIKAAEDSDIITIEGYANTTEKDRVGDVILEEAWTKGGLDNYLKNPIILAFHNHEKPIGSMVDYGVNSKGLKIVAEISKAAGEVYDLIKQGILKTFSVGFRVKDADYDIDTDIFVIKDLELYEISVVSVPANADSVFSVKKCLKDEEIKELKKEYLNMPENKKDDQTTDVNAPAVDQIKKDLQKTLEEAMAQKLKESQETIIDSMQAALELALEDKKEKDNVPEKKVEAGETGAEKLLKELQERLENSEKSMSEALEGLHAQLKEKSEELEAIQKSKMKFNQKESTPITQDEIDTAVLVSKALGVPIEKTKFGKELIEKSGAEHVPGSADASDWEKEFSNRIQNDMRQRLIVEPLFNSITMNTYAMQIPINPEADVAEWVPTSSFRSTDGSSTGTAKTHALTDTTLKAYKLASKEFIGYEEEEDAIIPIVPVIRDAVVRRLARSSDIALLRGAQAGATPTDPIQGVGTLAAAAGAEVSNPVGTKVTVSTMQTLRRNLGVWGLNPQDVTYVVSSEVYYDLLEDPDFRTVDLVGSKATILTGQIGMINGSPVLVSGEFAPKAVGDFGAVAINKSNFITGNLRGIMVERDKDIINQKNVIVATRRMGFIPIISGSGSAVLTWAA